MSVHTNVIKQTLHSAFSLITKINLLPRVFPLFGFPLPPFVQAIKLTLSRAQ